MTKRKQSKFDIRHKETLTLFLKEYFELFFPDMAEKIQFETAKFLDKELISLFGKSEEQGRKADQHRITDALILVEILLDNTPEQIMIHWEQESKKKQGFEERMFHYFCGIYFKHRKPVFPVAMFTDAAVWKKPLKNTFEISLHRYPVSTFTYQMVRLKNRKAEEFEKKAEENPLAAAYLPLTDYPEKERPVIKAKAMKGIAKVPAGQRQATLFSLIQESLPLNSEEEKQFQELVRDNPVYQEVKMLQSVKDVWIEEGMEMGIHKGKEIGIREGKQLGIREGKQLGIREGKQLGIREGKQLGIREGKQLGVREGLQKTAKNLLLSGKLTKKEIADITGLKLSEINKLAKELNTGA